LEQGQADRGKPPLRPKHVWSIWTTLQIEGRARDLTMFNLVIDSKLRGSNLAHERPLCAEAAVPQMLIPELSAGQIGRREIRGLPNESTPLRNIDPALTPQYAQFGLRTLDGTRFSLISRCTHRVHAAF
jgi:hypothetical protein